MRPYQELLFLLTIFMSMYGIPIKEKWNKAIVPIMVVEFAAYSKLFIVKYMLTMIPDKANTDSIPIIHLLFFSIESSSISLWLFSLNFSILPSMKRLTMNINTHIPRNTYAGHPIICENTITINNANMHKAAVGYLRIKLYISHLINVGFELMLYNLPFKFKHHIRIYFILHRIQKFGGHVIYLLMICIFEIKHFLLFSS